MRAILLACSACLLVACGSPGSAKITADRKEAASAGKPGWKEIETSGFAMSFPAVWTVLDLTKDDFAKIAQEVAQKDPGMAPAVQQAKAAAASGMIKLMAFDTARAKAEFAPNMNVAVTPSAPSLKEELAMNELNIERMIPGAKAEATTAKLPVGEVGLMTTRVTMAGNKLEIRAYLVLHGGNTHTFSFTDLETNARQNAVVADEIMQTLSFR